MLLLAVAKIFRRWKSKAPCCDIHPFKEVAIIGMPDERWGEASHAFVVLKAGATTTEIELRNYARDHLAHFKANSDLRLQTSDSEQEHEQEQERCIRASSFLRPSSFAC